MIHVVTGANRRDYANELHSFFRIRYEIYVRERGWKEIDRPDGLERDQFDNETATYVLALDNGQIVGGSRLVPSTEPHLLSEVFPHLARVRGVPCGPDICEWTRMFVVKERREGRNLGRTAGSVICGVLEHCLAQGVSALTAIIEMFWLPRFHDMGWTIRPLGLPELISGEWSVAVLMPIDESVLQSTRALHGIGGSVLVGANHRAAKNGIAA